MFHLLYSSFNYIKLCFCAVNHCVEKFEIFFRWMTCSNILVELEIHQAYLLLGTHMNVFFLHAKSCDYCKKFEVMMFEHTFARLTYCGLNQFAFLCSRWKKKLPLEKLYISIFLFWIWEVFFWLLFQKGIIVGWLFSQGVLSGRVQTETVKNTHVENTFCDFWSYYAKFFCSTWFYNGLKFFFTYHMEL